MSSSRKAPDYAQPRTDRSGYTAEDFAREAFHVLDSTHAMAYGKDALPDDHGTCTYCYACEFAWALKAFLERRAAAHGRVSRGASRVSSFRESEKP